MKEIFEVLETVQEKGIIHRDLRQENILVDTKSIGLNDFVDDVDFCPYNVQVLNYG